MKITITNLLNLAKDYQQTTNGQIFYSFSLVKMFPDNVYYCQCLKIDVMMCLVNGDYSFMTKSFMENYNEFLTTQIDIEINE